MASIRLGIIETPPFLYISGPSSLGGFAAETFLTYYYFIMDSVNFTLVSIPRNSFEFCPEQGYCNDSLGEIQRDRVDYVGYMYLNELTTVGTNLTVIPAAFDEDCQLYYSRKVKMIAQKFNFFDFVFEFPVYFWVLLMILFGLFILISIPLILRRNGQIKLINVLWSQFDYIMGQNFITSNRLIESKYFSLAFIISILITGKILSASIVTGLVQQSDYLKLETLQDVIKYNYTVVTIDFGPCTGELDKSIDPLAHLVRSKAVYFTGLGSTPEDYYQAARRKKHATIERVGIYLLNKNYGCIFSQELEDDEPLGLSNTPIFKILFGGIMHKRSPPWVKKVIQDGVYSVLEFAILKSNMYQMLQNRAVSGRNQGPPSCVDKDHTRPQDMYSPITLNYLSFGFTILFTGVGLSSISFVYSCISR